MTDPCGTLHVRGPYEFTDLELLNGDRDRVDGGVKQLDAELAPGIYVVRARLGLNQDQRLVRVPSKGTVTVDFSDLALRPPLAALAGGPALGSLWPPLEQGDGAVAVLAEVGAGLPNVALLDAGERRRRAVEHVSGELAGFRESVAPGNYALEFDVPGRGRRRQPVHVAPAFETQLFVSRSAEEAPLVAVYMRPFGTGYDRDLIAYGKVDAALDGLLRGKVVLSDWARGALVNGELDDPMLALCGAWASFVAGATATAEAALPLLDRLLPESPDVRVLRLLVARGRAPIGAPPLLAMATRELLQRAATDAELVPAGSWLGRIAPRLRSGGPWTRWDAELSPAEVREELARALRAVRRQRGRVPAPLGDLPKGVVDDIQLSRRAAASATASRIGRAIRRAPVLLWARSPARATGRLLEALEAGARVRGDRPDPCQLVRNGCQRPGERSSRSSVRDAGWPTAGTSWEHGNWEDRLSRLDNRRWRDFSWLTAPALLDSANDQIAKLIHDVINDRRQQWVAAQRAAGAQVRCPDLTIAKPDATRCVILGDPGEADPSQYAVVDPLLAVDAAFNSDFMVVLSDVIYPAGDINDYVNGFYEAYRDYRKPILAIPGNHDWYDGLDGFMFHFCGAESLPPTSFRGSSYGTPERVARVLWRASARPDRSRLLGRRFARDPGWKPEQPGPYWALDMRGVRLVAIDTGIKGTIDREQGEWLLRVSAGALPKVLLTGKPLWVDGEPKETAIEWGDSGAPRRGLDDVDAVIRDRHHNYVASIGGDVHNYQRLTVSLTGDEPRDLEYVVAGGSGAYMSATHRIGRVGDRPSEQPVPPGVERPADAAFRCYPTRGDSLAYYARWFGRRAVKAFAIAVVVLTAALAATEAWIEAGGQPRQGLLDVMVASFLGIAAIALVVGCAGWLARKLRMPRGYRTVTVLLLVPAALALAAVGLEYALGDTWDWAWKAALLGVAVLLLPVVGVLIGYYGYGPGTERRMRLDLTACVIGAALVLLYVGDFTTLGATATTLGLALLGTAVLLRILTLARPALQVAAATPEGLPGRLARNAWFYFPLTLLVYGVAPAALIVAFWDVDAVRTALAAFLMLVIVASGLLVAIVALGGRRALWDIALGRTLDADKALSYLHYLGIAETLPDEHDPSRLARVGDFDYRTVRLCDLLLPGVRGPRACLNKLVTEVGNADKPPMFKSFVTLAVEEDELVISCYGVTGWNEHEQDVPREDCVRIPLPGVPDESVLLG